MSIGIACMGTIAKNGKNTISFVANRTALLKNKSKSIWISRIEYFSSINAA